MIELDVHAHLVPIDAVQLAALPGIQWCAEDERLTIDGHLLAIKDLFHPERLLAWMDSQAISHSWISVPPPLYRQGLDMDSARVWCKYINAGLQRIVTQSTERLSALLHLPLEHPALVRELTDNTGLPAEFAGVALAAGGHPGVVLSDPVYLPLWQWLDQHKVFTFLHPGTCTDARLSKYYLDNLIGNPHETGIAAAHLVMAGIPSRFAGIRFCLAHAGGSFTALVGRLDHGLQTKRPGVSQEIERPLQAARRFHVDCIAHCPELLQLAGTVFGSQHVLFGSDWPFPMGLKEAS